MLNRILADVVLVVHLLYPSGLTRTHQIILGIVVLMINVAVYYWIWRRSMAVNCKDGEAVRY